MSPSSRKWAWRGAAVAAGGAALYAVLPSFVQTVKSDPLRPYRDATRKPDDAGVEMRDFDWKVYKGDALVATAHVAEAKIGRDRDSVHLATVSDGVYFDAKKPVFRFQAENAVYWSDRGSLSGNGKTRVFNDRMDLMSLEFKYDPGTKTLKVPKNVVGKLNGGDVKAEWIAYKVADKSFEIGPFKWSGAVEQDGQRKRWNIVSVDPKGKATLRGDEWTYPKMKATDGEIIVIADSCVYNQKTEVMTAKGHVQYFGSDANSTCDQIVVYRKEGRAVLTGNVDLLVKPKNGGKPEEVKIPPFEPVVPDDIKKTRPEAPPNDDARSDQEKQLRNGDNLRDYPIAITAAKIEYWYKKGQRRALITGNPQARQELSAGAWRMVWATSAVYDGEAETLDLKSAGDQQDVRMLNSLGDDGHAVSILVSTKEGENMMDTVGLTLDMAIDEGSEGVDRNTGGGKSTGGGTGGGKPNIFGPIKKRG
ncbi:MAG: hypothetical protein JST30_15165 [Armatimonadetes bacterium]|nr:hypothetical protein [Armatimonadota bacterium]